MHSAFRIFLSFLLCSFLVACNTEETELTVEEVALVEQAKQSLESKTITAADLLIDARYQGIRPTAEFKWLIRDNCFVSELDILPSGEEGQRLHVHGLIRDPEGNPIPGALLHPFQTDARGWYNPKASDDERHVRLYGFLKTDDQGRFLLKTVMPGHYAHSKSTSKHIHFLFKVDGYVRAVGEGPQSLYFADDPTLVGASREEAIHDGGFIGNPQKGKDGILHCNYVMIFKNEEGMHVFLIPAEHVLSDRINIFKMFDDLPVGMKVEGGTLKVYENP